ncbi:metal ABC transporter substrate-binding protein [Streptomyces sp. N2-109]|uniref:Metal ABC transporter substrate-binding protein n=1 Tax=Streptomyces gossypii TaxID=2883101 RepID=A0ABT2JSJ9_9ACTN|nr:zinc ABC transporter substrate-binding protein AztC [Streptomyces gossypii]MCT2590855.1 metal ABC transporter substrate-binding protein [Streptomyces gossypii]
MRAARTAGARTAAARTAAARTAGAALVCALVAGLTTSCTGSAGDRPAIVVTTNILGDVTRNVVGDQADVTVLMKANADPHSFGVSARQAAEIEQADLVVYNGLGLEENVLRHVDAAESSGVPTVAVGERTDPLPYASGGTKGEPDPHFWTDPQRVEAAAELLGEEVAKHVDGVDKKAVKAHAAAYGKKLDGLHSWMRKRFGEIPEEERNLVTNHHVFGYLAERYHFRVIGAVIPSGTTLASPSAADLESLSSAIEKARTPAIFVDSSQPDRLAKVLKEESDLEVRVIPLFSESLTPKGEGAATYLQMMRANTKAIADGLKTLKNP